MLNVQLLQKGSKYRKLVVTLILSASFNHVYAEAPPKELLFGISTPSGSIQGETAREFVRRANHKLDGKFHINLLTGGKLGSDKQLIWKLRKREIHFALPSSIMGSIVPEFSVFSLPYLIQDRDHISRVENELLSRELGHAADTRNLHVLALWENGFRHISNNVRAIVKPSDLKGLKIRIPKSMWREKLFKSWGAEPQQMKFSDTYAAILTGRIDAQENPYTNIWSAKLHKIQYYISDTKHTYSPAFLTVSIDWYKSLDNETKDILNQTARELSLWARTRGKETDGALRAKLIENGVRLNKVDIKAFRQSTRPIYQQYVKSLPQNAELIRNIQALAE